jgi:pantetheine-phosphate adenylyltransferase, bacterial
MKRAVFPGSFDPITLGHVDIINRALPLFDEIIIAIGVNADKKYLWSLEDRKRFIEATFASEKTIRVKTYSGLTVDFCKAESANFILRGLRNTTDFTYEQSIAQTNVSLAGVESVFIVCSPKFSNISSSIVRDVFRNGGDISGLVPKAVIR